MQRWLIAAAVTCVAATGCSEAPQETTTHTARRPQQVGPTNPFATVGHLAGIEATGLTGDPRAMRGHVEAMHTDMMRSMHLAYPSSRIDHEAARAAVRPLQSVQSAVWIDNTNLLVLVDGGQCRSMPAIDNVFLAMGPLGDTLSRNCQLGAGERAMFQQKRQVDVLESGVRRGFRAQHGMRK